MVQGDGALVACVQAVRGWSPKPTKLRVFTMENETVMVAVSKARNRWARLHQTLAPIDWVRVEGLNAKDELVGVYDHPDVESLQSQAAAELETIEMDKTTSQVYAMATLIEKAADRAVQRMGEHHKAVLESALQVIDTLSDRLVQVHAQEASNLETIRELMASGGEEATTMAVAEMATKLLTAGKGKAKTPNGAS